MGRPQVKQAVYEILCCDKGARGNDERLYAIYCRDYMGIDLSELGKMMLDGTAPKFESTGRRRRLLQSNDPTLKPSVEKQQERLWSEEHWEEHWAS